MREKYLFSLTVMSLTSSKLTDAYLLRYLDMLTYMILYYVYFDIHDDIV